MLEYILNVNIKHPIIPKTNNKKLVIDLFPNNLKCIKKKVT